MKKNHTMFLLTILTNYCIQEQNISIKNTSACNVYKIITEKDVY